VKIIISIGITLTLILVVFSATLVGQRSKNASMSHTEWVGNTLKEIRTIKVGMKRKDLLKIFEPDGGLGSGRTFLYRNCPYIKVDVEFDRDTITKISTPYLDNPTLD
jgi:hypothetical protein